MTPNISEQTTASRAGVVGLGMIGGGVAISLARRGRTPLVYDVRPEAADLEGGPELAASPADVASRCDVVLVAVVTAEQAREVLGGASGLLAAARPGLTVALLSTVELPVVREFAGTCAEYGVGFLDCGVTPGDQAAVNGMVTMVGGDERTLAHARPVLDDFAKDVVHCGPLGAGMVTKVARNVVTYGSWRAVAEAASLASAGGVDPNILLRVIDTADPDGATLLSLLRMQHLDDDGAIAMARRIGPSQQQELDGPRARAAVDALVRGIAPLLDKDLAAAQQLAGALDVDLPLADTAREHARDTLGIARADDTAETERT